MSHTVWAIQFERAIERCHWTLIIKYITRVFYWETTKLNSLAVKQFNLNYKLTNLECRPLLLPYSRQLVANNSSLVYLWLLDLKTLEILATLLVFILKCKKNNVINSCWLSACLFLVPKVWQFESTHSPGAVIKQFTIDHSLKKTSDFSMRLSLTKSLFSGEFFCW